MGNDSPYFTTSVVLTCKYVKVASVTVNIYQVELALVVVVSCFSRPSVLRYEHPPMEKIQGTGYCSRFENEIHDDK